MFKNYIKEINKITNVSPLFYITYDTNRAIGLEELIRSYHIIDGNFTYTSKLLQERELFSYTVQQKKHNSYALFKDKKVEEYIIKNSSKRPYVQFFKPTAAIEQFAKDAYQIANANAHISTLIEDKISQYSLLLEHFQEFLPKTIITRLSQIDTNSFMGNFDNGVVIQFDRGHAGNNTFFINNKSDLINFLQDEIINDRKIKCTELLVGKPLTVNGVATSRGTFVGGLSDQITGIKEIKAKQGEACGNNWCQQTIQDFERKAIVALCEKAGNFIFSKGFRGQFGIDVFVTAEKIYLIEINARQTTSTQIYTKLQIENGQIPLSFIHLLEFFGIENTIDISQYNNENSLPISASSLIIRNNTKNPLRILNSYNGIYDIETIQKKEDAYAITELYSLSTALILESLENNIIEPDEEIFKIQVRGSLIDEDNFIDKNILKIVQKVLNITKIITYE